MASGRVPISMRTDFTGDLASSFTECFRSAERCGSRAVPGTVPAERPHQPLMITVPRCPGSRITGTFHPQGQVAVHHGLNLAVQLLYLLPLPAHAGFMEQPSRAWTLLSQDALMEHSGPALVC